MEVFLEKLVKAEAAERARAVRRLALARAARVQRPLLARLLGLSRRILGVTPRGHRDGHSEFGGDLVGKAPACGQAQLGANNPER